jgi:hypothetical protein
MEAVETSATPATPLGEPTADTPDAPAVEALPPKLMMARYHPLLASATLHELQLDSSAGGSGINITDVCGLALDDHRGLVIVVTEDQVIHYIPYA